MLKYLFQDINIVVEYLAFLISFFGPELRDKQKINRKMFPILAFHILGRKRSSGMDTCNMGFWYVICTV